MPKPVLTQGQKVFVDEFVKTGDARVAAHRAGFRGANYGYDVQRKPAVASAIEARRATKEQLEAAGPLVSQDLIDRLTGRKGPELSHADASKLHGVFWKVWMGLEGAKPLGDLDPSEMTPEQLQTACTLLEAELHKVEASLASRARPVEAIEEPVALNETEADSIFD